MTARKTTTSKPQRTLQAVPDMPKSSTEQTDEAQANGSRTEIIVHRATRRSAEAYIARFPDALGDTTTWNGSVHVPVHIEWAVVPAERGFDVVSTVSPRPAAPVSDLIITTPEQAADESKTSKTPAAKTTASKTTAAKPAPAKKTAAASTKLSTDTETIPTDPTELRTLIKITRDRRWRAGKRDDAALVKQMTEKLELLTAAAEKLKGSESAPAKTATASKTSKTTAAKPAAKTSAKTAAAKTSASKTTK